MYKTSHKMYFWKIMTVAFCCILSKDYHITCLIYASKLIYYFRKNSSLFLSMAAHHSLQLNIRLNKTLGYISFHMRVIGNLNSIFKNEKRLTNCCEVTNFCTSAIWCYFLCTPFLVLQHSTRYMI